MTKPETITLPRWLWGIIGTLSLLLAGTATTAVVNASYRLGAIERDLSTVRATAVTEMRVREIVASDAPYATEREFIRESQAEMKAVVSANTKAIGDLRVLMAERLRTTPDDVAAKVDRVTVVLERLEHRVEEIEGRP